MNNIWKFLHSYSFGFVIMIFFIGFFNQSQGQSKFIEVTFGDKSNPQKGILKLSGKILELESDTPIPNVVLSIKKIGQTVLTNDSGYFEMALPPGKSILGVSIIGYNSKAYEISIYESGELNIFLKKKDFVLDEVIIQDEAATSKTGALTDGLERISAEQMERKSLLLGETDVLRSIQSVSGVSSVGEGASGFNVRGGNIDENLILHDGGLIFNPTHALGFFSLFQPDLVSSVELYKGGLPAKFGGRLASVLEVNLREGDREKYGFRGGVGLASSRISAEGPILKDKFSFITGARVSYVDWLLNAVNNLDLKNSNAFFYDFTTKIDGNISPSTKVGISVFATHDDFQFAKEAKLDYETKAVNAYLKQIIGENISINADLNGARYVSSLFDVLGSDQSQFTTTIDNYHARLNGLVQLGDNNQLNLGAEANYYGISPGEISPFGEESTVFPDKIPTNQGLEISAYIEDKLQIGDFMEASIGLRYTRFQNLGAGNVFLYEEGIPKQAVTITDTLSFGNNEKIAEYDGLEPRISLKFNLNEKNVFKLGYNKSYQYISQISNTAAASPISLWQLSNYHIQPKHADSYTMGFYHNNNDRGIAYSGSIFYRDIHQLVEYKDFAQLVLNDHIETELVSGIGRAYGLEFSFNKTQGKHQVEMNYTYSRTLIKIEPSANQVGVNGGEWYPGNYDKPHILNLSYFLQTGKGKKLAVNFTYSSGRPTTAPVSVYGNSNITNIPVYSLRNQFRIPDYHRMDVSYTIDIPRKKDQRLKNSLTFSVYNLYARKNAYSVYFRQTPFQSVSAYQISVLGTVFPSITYNFTY